MGTGSASVAFVVRPLAAVTLSLLACALSPPTADAARSMRDDTSDPLFRPRDADEGSGSAGRVKELQRQLHYQLRSGAGEFNTEGFMRDWMANPGPELCGDWQRTFSRTHEKIRAGEMPQRYITFNNPERVPSEHARSGLGDYLNGMVSTFLAALLTDRAFVMEESPLTPYLDPADIDWTMGNDVPLDLNRDDVALMEYFNGVKNDRFDWTDAVNYPADILEEFSGLDSKVNIRVGTNGGVLSQIFRNASTSTYFALHEKGLRMPTAFGCIARFLFRPKENVWRVILPQVKALRKHKRMGIGIHFRTNDKFAFDKNSTEQQDFQSILSLLEETAIACAQKTMDYHAPQGVHTIWLLLSDSAELRKVARHKYPERIMGSPVKPAHPMFHGNTALGSALSEWLLLSVNHHFIITESGYAKTAVAYNLEHPTIFLYAHFLFGAQGTCDQSRPNSLLDFTRWSGL